jgi:hypothetical protein
LPDQKDPKYGEFVEEFTDLKQAMNKPHVGVFCERCPVDRSGAAAPRLEAAPPRTRKSARKK